MKRILLFIATNFAILIVLGIVLNIVLPLMGIHLQDTGGLLMISAVFGLGGSFISLAISKWIAKRSVGAYVIEEPRNAQEEWLLKTVKRQAVKAGVGMPEVAIYDSPDINAFATGMNKNNALVAVSSGLLGNMTADEAEAVLGHEMSHIANGDMVTMTLLQGVMNTFVFFFARIVARAVSRGSDNQFFYFMTVMAFQIIFGMLASIIVMWFSRYREFRADAGGANLAGREKMINALKRLQRNKLESQLNGQLVAFGISGKQAFSELLMSHPPLEKRIKALQRQA
ncbi:Heat shock protein, Metallo peptidase, MEROPS family M48B [Psychromonas ingrahamii 37]|uniref:Protease HtpX n=1 Tax=Psychromonas ingrahamii (strain DSM 17664 / CCUG 51855 / 37) TaxID=357804 RepID=A1SYN9_PSYIN|nr:protease HtpX [Psychromonas ingrahamii]ABM04604.1 Heat shock protein, Metallo peptidase, MEROPS family M48B [Psychromonas ingrahamii 37]